MNFIKKIWPSPIHCVLIPVFFLLHNYVDFYNIVDFSKLTISIISWMLLPFCLVAAYRYVFKDLSKASLITSTLLLLFFFAGPLIKETRNVPYINYLFKYSVLIPVLLFCIILLHRRLYKSKKKYLLTHRFISITTLLLIGYELFAFFTIVAPNRATYNKLQPAGTDLAQIPTTNDPNRPDIYFLIFDEMPSVNSVNTLFQYNNAHVTDSLTKLGFVVSPKAQSAYPSTPLSIASTLSLTDFGYPADTVFSFKDFAKADVLVQNNQLFPFLKKSGYNCVNASIFNVNNLSSPIRTYINVPQYVTWGVQENMIKNQTFFNRMHEDIGWNFTPLFLKNLVRNLNKDLRNEVTYTNKLRSLIDSCLHSPHQEPLFFYGHFFLPHMPYKFDSAGTALQWTVPDYKAGYKKKENYVAQVKYAGKLIYELSKKIVTESKRPAIIIIQGDHGHRDYDKKKNSFSHKVSILSAVYFPDKDYSSVDDAFYAPNTFRIVLNKYFSTHLPLLKNPNNFEKQPVSGK
ncbi:MAG: sulfatase-like hydrolase/transferase [Lacibacter sp.]